MSRPIKSEDRRKQLLLLVPKGFENIESWATVAEGAMKAKYVDRHRRLYQAAKLFLQKQPVSALVAASGMPAFRVLDYIEKALEPWKDGTGITGTRAFVSYAVQSKRTRTAELPTVDPEDRKKSGLAGAFWKLLKDHSEIEAKLTEFLDGLARPNKVTPKNLHAKFLLICTDEIKLTVKDYPLCCTSKAFAPLQHWFKTIYLPAHLLAHLRRNSGKAAAVAASHQMGDGERRTPASDYVVWVIDECDCNLDTKIEVPNLRWGGDVIRMRRFPVLRLRSTGAYAMNIAFHLCYTRQASGPDIVKLFRNAVLGQPVPPMVDPNLRPEEGAGFPQNMFEELRFAVPAIVYLDNALAHLYGVLQELLTRLFGCRVELGRPGDPKGRAEIESNIHQTRRCFTLQLPGALGSGPSDPLRKHADCPTEQLVHANHFEQAMYCVLANENISDSASAGYLDAFTRLKARLARGDFEVTKLAEHLRKGYYFCTPMRKRVKCDIGRSGRLPYIELDRRYSSAWLKGNPPDGVVEYWVLQDDDDLRTCILLDDRMCLIDTLMCAGSWGRIPFDRRMLRIYNQRKRAARFKLQPRDLPLFQVLQYLADGAKSDWTMAQDFAYIMSYLKRALSPEELSTAQMEWSTEEAPLVFDDGYLPASATNARSSSTEEAAPRALPPPVPAEPPAAGPSRPMPKTSPPRLFGRRVMVPRGMR
ncbi:hypothetical protein [Roseateles sp. MS654]|uniref:hypothetical protein n=1 Tax=Roseateles sp. MS654 TaxID=3412685 RepID=UPI003C2FAD60